MTAAGHFTRVNTLEIKSHIEKKLGRTKSEKYFDLLIRLLHGKMNKPEFDRLCIGTIGIENMRLHNLLLTSMLKNACLSKTPPSKETKVEGSLGDKVANGLQSSLQSMGKDSPQSPQRGRTPNPRDCKLRDLQNPPGPPVKSHRIAREDSICKIQEQQSATELLSLGSRPPCSVEEGEEVDQAAASPSIYSRSPVRAPLGIPTHIKGMRKVLHNSLTTPYYSDVCQNTSELPDTSSLKKRLEQKLEMEGLKVSLDCANLLNNGLDVFMRRLIRPCLELAGSRSMHEPIDQGHGSSIPKLNEMWTVRHAQKTSGFISASVLDFQSAIQLNPQILGGDWPTQLEKVCLHASED